jgi:hypothetical protein
MSATKRRSVVENVFDRNQRREAEINEALKQEAVRHAAVVKNMHRLRALRLAREEKRRARNSRLRRQLFIANNRRRVDNQRGSTMSTSDDYRAMAEECFRRAQEAPNR